MNGFVISSILIVLAGFMAMSYRGYAEKYGWPIGSIWYKKEGWCHFFVFATVIPGAIELMQKLSFFKGVGVTAILFVVAPVIMYLFKTYSQYLIYIFTLLSIVIWIIFGTEIHTA